VKPPHPGTALALDLLREAGMYLGVGIANLINILAPEKNCDWRRADAESRNLFSRPSTKR